MSREQIHILGAGLVGSLLATLLAKRGFQVAVFEKRTDPRKAKVGEGRSINLALSHRGIRALQLAGVYEAISADLIPMKGRMMHDQQGHLAVQPYGKEGQFINSVSRAGLNRQLIAHAEKAGARFHFDHRCEAVDLRNTQATFTVAGQSVSHQADVLLGADGAFSALRSAMQLTDRFNYQQHYIEHGYKELSIEPQKGDFALEPNYLHIWPRGHFMLIALPNPDKSFTCTLFFPFTGNPSFGSLRSKAEIVAFFETYFPDVIPLMPDFAEQFAANPTSSLVTVRCAPWHHHRCLLIGDSAHAIVPFYGQGMNAGFEDCRLLIEWGEQLEFDWDKLLPFFSEKRKPDAEAIADLALKNFVEMRDRVADQRFLDIKKLEARLNAQYPTEWIPLYSMVTFTDTPYREALEKGKLQEKVTAGLPQGFDPDTVDLEQIMRRFRESS